MRAVALLLVLAGCGEGAAQVPSAAPTTVAAVPTSAPTVVVTVPNPTTVSGPRPECGPYVDRDLGPAPNTIPPTTTPAAPLDPGLESRALGPGDVPCTRETTVEAQESFESGQFSPCGFPFADTSTALGQYHIVVQPAGGYAGDRLWGPSPPYVEETVARFTPAGAERVLASFRSHVAACPVAESLPAPWNGHRFEDQPFWVVNGEVQAQGWNLHEVTVLAEADDVYAVEFFCCEPGAFLLVAMRRGPYVAFVRTFFSHGQERVATPFLVAAAGRLAGG